MFDRFPLYRQLEEMDCGATCLKMIAKYYGKDYPVRFLRQESSIDREGASLKGISDAADVIGLRATGVKLPFQGTEEEAGLLDVQLPCIAYWKQRHFLVIYKANQKHIWVADPAFGKKRYDRKSFERGWFLKGEKGVLLLLEPSPRFYQAEIQAGRHASFTYVFQYLKPYRKLFMQLLIGLLLGSLFSILFPFLTQAIVDVGIANQDLNFVYLILLAQLMLFLSSAVVSIIQSWILLHIGVRINVALVYDFLIKLTKLPIRFFHRRIVGDILQRIDDHERINNFLTSASLNVIFSFFNLIVFSLVLLFYNIQLFTVFWIASVVYIAWIILFLKKRREIDYQRFEVAAANQNKLLEIINGMQELKLQNSEKKRRWQWADIQAKMFKVSMRGLTLQQIQGTGANLINQLKNIFISFLAAKAVIDGELTLGMMLAVQYIIGQLNAPLVSMISFIQNAQDAKIGLERLSDIHEQEEEEKDTPHRINYVPETGALKLEQLSFRYTNDSDDVLQDINLEIPRNGVTAIVGSSGSGKTTLIRLLLGFYEPTGGHIKLGPVDLSDIRKSVWRRQCGAVLQDGFIFPDTVAHNIGESDDYVDNAKLFKAAETANIREFIESLRAGYNTPIGEKGMQLSQGQKQRLLIARAVYKDPSFIFFDEATNALDANNEKVIMRNLEKFYEGKTVIVVAHRLSTVKHADQIIVLEKGKIIERGTHQSLVDLKGSYFNLVVNQLELGQ